jgi:two-component system sensor histidine kinase/response regulator
VGFARDVTQRREIESRLRESEQALRDAQAIALVGSWTLDLRRDEMRWSDETYRIFEVPQGTELRQDSFLARIHPDDLSSVRNAWDNVSSGCPFDIEHRIVIRDGIRWVRERAEVRLDERGEAFFAVGTVQDVTERRTAEEQLRKLWLAVEQSPNSIVITDTEAHIEYVNQAFVDSTGYSREEALGHNPRLMDSGQTPKNTYRELWAALTRRKTWEGEFVNRRRHGSLYTESARISPVRQPSGQITHYLAVKEDITERKQASAELERYRHHLEELVAERTAELAASKDAAEAASRAKSAFLANMSHEIRTPLNAIVGLTYLLQRRIGAPEAQRQIGKVTEAANHLLTLINDILDISKIEAGKLTLNQTEFESSSWPHCWNGSRRCFGKRRRNGRWKCSTTSIRS